MEEGPERAVKGAARTRSYWTGVDEEWEMLVKTERKNRKKCDMEDKLDKN